VVQTSGLKPQTANTKSQVSNLEPQSSNLKFQNRFAETYGNMSKCAEICRNMTKYAVHMCTAYMHCVYAMHTGIYALDMLHRRIAYVHCTFALN